MSNIKRTIPTMSNNFKQKKITIKGNCSKTKVVYLFIFKRLCLIATVNIDLLM